MKTLNLEQMEAVKGARFSWACLGQVADGMGLLGGAAFLISASNPIGWGILLFSAVGFAASAIADPTACD